MRALVTIALLFLLGPLSAQGRLVTDNAYPSYEKYVGIMRELARRYPDRCVLENWGTLPSGRQILTLRLSKNAYLREGEPQVLLTAAMHGDETAGYWLMLRLAEDLLTNDDNYLLNDLEVFINPLANPDGAYAGGNASLDRATRGNSAGVDLNRNYPDPDDGSNPDGHPHQPETAIFMRAAAEHDFDLALNIHGGAELFNYPWDTYRSRHPDSEWWRRVSRDFARRAQRASGSRPYFTDRHNGITNGHDWYPVAGSRQDYMNYYHRTKEATVEISNQKRYPASKLSRLWGYSRPSLLGFLGEARLGLRGTVTDTHTGRPLRALLSIPGHDAYNSAVFSDRDHGRFYRYLAPGIYRVQFSAPGYVPRNVIVTIEDGQPTRMDVALTSLAARK